MPKHQQKAFGVPPSICLPTDERTQPPAHPATQGEAKLKVKQVQPPGNYTPLCIIYLCATAIRKKRREKRSFPCFHWGEMTWKWHHWHHYPKYTFVSGVPRPFPNEAHVLYYVYFETLFAYFSAMIKRTFRVFCRRHLNPVDQESFFLTPAAASNNIIRTINPTAQNALLLPTCKQTLLWELLPLGGRTGSSPPNYAKLPLACMTRHQWCSFPNLQIPEPLARCCCLVAVAITLSLLIPWIKTLQNTQLHSEKLRKRILP